MLTRIVSSTENPPGHQLLQGCLLVNTDVVTSVTDDGVTVYEYTQIVSDSDNDPDAVLIEYKADIAQIYLDQTDFYFAVDRYQQLTEEEKTELEAKRESARQDVRAHEDSEI